MKICIPSKGRPETMTTQRYFRPEDVIIFVEPQEIKAYNIFQPSYQIVDIKKSNQGVSYVRNFIIDYMQEDKILMIDDDIFFIGKVLSDGHYEDLDDIYDLVSDAEKMLDKYWGYVVPFSIFAYFISKNYDCSRDIYQYDKTALVAFFGLNLKKLKERSIRFDENFIEGEDCDIAVQILIQGGHLCSNYKYSMNHKLRVEGGMSNSRKFRICDVEKVYRTTADSLSKKYGSEFIQTSHDEEGYLTGCRPRLDLIIKRKDLVLKYFKKYQKSLKAAKLKNNDVSF